MLHNITFKFTFSVHVLSLTRACVSWFISIQTICTILHNVCRAFHQHFECFFLFSYFSSVYFSILYRHTDRANRKVWLFLYNFIYNWREIVVDRNLNFFLQQVGFTGDFNVWGGWVGRKGKHILGGAGDRQTTKSNTRNATHFTTLGHQSSQLNYPANGWKFAPIAWKVDKRKIIWVSGYQK